MTVRSLVSNGSLLALLTNIRLGGKEMAVVSNYGTVTITAVKFLIGVFLKLHHFKLKCFVKTENVRGTLKLLEYEDGMLIRGEITGLAPGQVSMSFNLFSSSTR